LAHLDVDALAIEAADLCGRQCQAMGGVVRGAVSDDQHCHAPRKPAGFRPVGMAPIGTPRETMAATRLLEAADNRPAIVANPLEKGLRGIPGLTAEVGRAAA
jgi:hypothetical protein